MNYKHCAKCGQALIPTDPPRFDVYTGEKCNDICPTDKCDHHGRQCTYDGRFFPKCTQCGNPPWRH